MTLDEFIRLSLRKAAEETNMTDEQRMKLLIRILTVYLTKQME